MNRPILAFASIVSLFAISGPAVADGDATKGKSVFNQCRACHRLEEGKHVIGPSLHGLFGRKAGTVNGFNFSSAMKKYDVTWDEKTLDVYLENPRSLVPGTKMAYPGLKKADQRADLIAYLKQATK